MPGFLDNVKGLKAQLYMLTACITELVKDVAATFTLKSSQNTAAWDFSDLCQYVKFIN